MSHSSRRRRRPARTQQQRRQASGQRRPVAAPEPVDYSQDYAYVRYDMRRIAFWSILLFACLFGAALFI